jgi:hypothetical protein
MSKVQISKICLNIDGRKIEMTMKQAKKLSEVLNDTFGNNEVVFRDRWYTSPYPVNVPSVWPGATCTGDTPYQLGTTTTSAGAGANINAQAITANSTVAFSSEEWDGMLSANTMSLTAN